MKEEVLIAALPRNTRYMATHRPKSLGKFAKKIAFWGAIDVTIPHEHCGWSWCC